MKKRKHRKREGSTLQWHIITIDWASLSPSFILRAAGANSAKTRGFSVITYLKVKKNKRERIKEPNAHC